MENDDKPEDTKENEDTDLKKILLDKGVKAFMSQVCIFLNYKFFSYQS